MFDPFPVTYDLPPCNAFGAPIEPDFTKHPDYPRPDCTEPACGWPDPCEDCYDAAYREDVAAEELADAMAGLAFHKQQQADARDAAIERTDGHHEGDPAPVIGWGMP